MIFVCLLVLYSKSPLFFSGRKRSGRAEHNCIPWAYALRYMFLISFFFRWILISKVNGTPKAATPCQCLHHCFIIYCSSAVLNIEFSITLCTFLWNSFPIYFSISEILIYLSSCSHCEVTGWYYFCSMTWSWHMQDPEDIIHWSTSQEKWLGPRFQSRRTSSVIAVSFCEHTVSGSRL